MFIKRNNLIFFNSYYIYFGKIFGDKLEIINYIDSNSTIFISLVEKCFFCNKEKIKINADNSNNSFISHNSENHDEDI